MEVLLLLKTAKVLRGTKTYNLKYSGFVGFDFAHSETSVGYEIRCKAFSFRQHRRCISKARVVKTATGRLLDGSPKNFKIKIDMKYELRTHERFMEIAKDCKTKKDVKEKDISIFSKAGKEGWWKDCPWIPERSCSPRKWTDKRRWEAALKCKTKTEYSERFNGAYTYDNKHGLLDRYTHFEKHIAEGRDPNAEDYVIYVYRDEEHKVVYVGLTYEERKAKRHSEHVNGRKEDDGSVFYDVAARYWQSIGKPLPQPRYVMDELHINDVGYFEEWYIEHYKKAGWTVLNIAKGGSLGGAKVKWTYETCLEDSKNYDTRTSWENGNSPAYYKAVRNYTEDGRRWIDTFEWRDSHEVRSEASRKRQTGKIMSEERRKRHSELLKKHYAEHPKKKGNHLSEEHKKNISKSLKKYYERDTEEVNGGSTGTQGAEESI